VTSRNLYMYALIGAGPEGDLGTGLAGEPLRLVRRDGVGAVVGELSALPEVSADALSTHDATVRRVAELAPAILPVRFGQALPDERSLVAWLAEREEELAKALAQVEGCVQMTLRVFGEQAERTEGTPRTAGTASAGTRYLEERRRARTLPEIAPLREALRPLLRAERIERSLGQGLLLGTAYDLVGRSEAGEYARLIAEMAPQLEPFRVTASGPWPPYAFAPGLAG
jgi:Gas vesicle synthesis protein GvpL/GvpF